MRIDDRVRKTIAFVGIEGRDTFVAYGTAFIVAEFIDGAAFQTLVTARHVIDKIAGEIVCVRLNAKGGGQTVIRTYKEAWLGHPDPRIDVAVCPSTIPPEEFDILHLSLTDADILTEQVIAERDIGVGDEVTIAGLYVARMGESKNIPIVRVGTIAAMPEEKINTQYGHHDAYLVEVRSIDGLSGSPVFVQIPPWRSIKGQIQMSHGKVQYVMGMILGHHKVKNVGDTVEIVQPSSRPEIAPETIEVETALNTGIAIVLPIADVKAAIEQPTIRQRRQEKARAGKKIDP